MFRDSAAQGMINDMIEQMLRSLFPDISGQPPQQNGNSTGYEANSCKHPSKVIHSYEANGIMYDVME